MKHLLLIAGLTAAILPAVGAQIDPSKLPAASTRKDVTFDKDIKPLFEASCVRCHGEKKPKAGLRLDTREGVLKGGEDGAVVKTGDSAHSIIVVSISQLDPETAMPPKPRKRGPGGPGGPGAPGGGHGTNAPAGPGGPGGPGGNQPPPKPLTPEEVGLVRAWIDSGAK